MIYASKIVGLFAARQRAGRFVRIPMLRLTLLAAVHDVLPTPLALHAGMCLIISQIFEAVEAALSVDDSH